MTGTDGHAEDHGRVYQARGDQHITEHHHYGGDRAEHGGPDSVRRPAVGRCPVALRDRSEVMERLRESVRMERGGQVYVLYGMGGSGKTAVACALFEEVTGNQGRVGLWVNAADRASLRAGMLAVAADRGARDAELLAARNGLRPAADLVWRHLDRSAEPWLLVLDNADEPEILRDGNWLRTSPRGTVLVTTRRAAARWWPGAELQHIGVLPREDAALVLRDLAPHSGTAEQAARVADRLGRLPLALTLAGGFLSHQVIDPWTMDAYGEQLDGDERVRLIDRGADILSPADPRHLVGLTWQLTLDAFEARGLPEAAALLRLLARFAAEPLPLALLDHTGIGAVLPRARTETALRALLDQSLSELVEAAGTRCVQSHGILLDSVSAATAADLVPALDATAVRLLDAAVPAVPDAGPHEPRLRLLVPHALALLRHAGEPSAADALAVATRLAVALHRTGDYLSAWETARNAADLGQRHLGADHRTVLAARSRAGRALFRLGRYAEAEAALSAVRGAQERLFGAGDPDTADSGYGLQLVLANLGRREESVALLRDTVAARRSALGPAHPLTLRARASLLETLPAADVATEEGGALLTLPSECARHLGPDHTVTLGARHNHAWALYLLGRFDEADREIRQVAEAYARRFGPEYPVVLAARQLHSRTRAALGHMDEAIALMADVAERRARGLGPEHPFTAASRRLLDAYRSGLRRP
ncbi:MULTISPECIES: tetratricopeptide repeat protein [Streptomyces]|uniref:ATP/GTP-binding protein n=1 Tax=Streptomyces fradiae ATCC 10745 = DSM 40063 TaxID=1319510 RepID=A0A1Y2P0H6_STRFR|nr:MULTISPECIES: tetratricopeptide repeat protein [Streptomyces]KAF0647947.1 ATP/GTP-binding protein [Streptomyces fradiae ATCC 10745 = DSM 40063]OSY53090.1 Anaphase-promoting complex, cyclosome, subunit 3 [Streptomyces fradiae ATCC 10745 = DSM 40063]QEV14551.1 tetratricopeptide repeat protein [Streptomyces fradiae ATCC 10745 = DSM 40063]